ALTDITVDAPITATPGSVFLDSAGTMAITSHGSISTAPGSGGTLTINGGFAVNGAIAVGAGDITLISAAGNDLTINAPLVNVGTINLEAPRDVIINALVKTTNSTADINLIADV